jgi:hypothetical protein
MRVELSEVTTETFVRLEGRASYSMGRHVRHPFGGTAHYTAVWLQWTKKRPSTNHNFQLKD